MDSIPGSGRSPGGGYGNSLRYSCLENPRDRGAWRVTVHRVTQSQTRLKWLSKQACKVMESCISQWGLLLCIPSLSTVPLTVWLMFLLPRDGNNRGYIPSSWVKIGLGLSQAVPTAPMECGWRDPMWLLRFGHRKETTPSSTPTLILTSEPRAGFVRKPRILLDLFPMASISTRSAWSDLWTISVRSLQAFHFRSQAAGGEISLSSPVSCLISGCTDTVQDGKWLLLLSHCVLFNICTYETCSFYLFTWLHWVFIATCEIFIVLACRI